MTKIQKNSNSQNFNEKELENPKLVKTEYLRIKQATIDQIFETVQIEQVVGDFVDLKQKGVNYVGSCPFHNEKTPSFSVSPAKGIYKCFGCGVGGNSIGFIMQHEHKSYPEALTYLANKYNIAIEEEDPDPKREETQKQKILIIDFNKMVVEYFHKQLFLAENAIALEYVKNRFNHDTIEQWQIGFAPGGFTSLLDGARKKDFDDEFLLSTGLFKRSPKNNKIYDFFQNRIMFPVWDRHGHVISFAGRAMPDADKKQAKYINLGDTAIYKKSNVLYGLNFALTNIVRTKTATIVEGNPDCVKLHEIGIANVIAPSGTALAESQIKLLNRFAEKIILLYDGDKAGQNALLKNGKLLVENGLIPYAAVLPEDEDPDSFFTSEDQYQKWLNKNKTDFISWYANNLFKKIGEDPSLKNDAINHVCDLLIHVSSNKRQLYIDQIYKTSKVKGKLFTDRLKELEAKLSADYETKAMVPDNVDANDFEQWGFYEYKNAYYFRVKGQIQKLSNFIMKSVFHIDSIIDSKRIYELVNEHGNRVVVNLDMNEMTSLQGFQRNIEGKGNFMFLGQMGQFQKLKLKLYEETRTCVEVKNLGWQKEGFWAWANGIIDSEGKFIEIDEYGIIRHNDQDYFIPPFSKIYLKDKSIFQDERKFKYKKSDISLTTWMNLYLKVHGDNAMIAFAWYIAALFRDHIHYLNDNFPLLNLFGQKTSGKNSLAYSLLSLFGKKQPVFNLHNGTKPALAQHVEILRNAIAFLDEYKNSLDFDKIETIKSLYNSIGRSRMKMDNGKVGKKETTPVNQGAIIAGQEMPTIDVALSSRTIFLQFLLKDGLSNEEKQSFKKLQEMERDGLPHITVMFIKHRKYFIEYFKENYEAVMRQLVEATSKEEINERLLQNICTVMAAFKTLVPKFNFSFTYDQLFASGLEITRVHNKQIKQSDEIGVFWDLLEAIFDDNILLENWHFKVNLKTSLITTKGTKQFPDGKRILRFKFNSIAKLYAEHLRKRSEKPLPQDSLKHYLQTSKYFIGIEKSCKFTRRDFVVAEHKTIDKSQTTTAFCFDYDLLNINLEREGAETNNDINEHTSLDDHTEVKTVKAIMDDLPF